VLGPVWLDTENSLSLRQPMIRTDRKGDIRLNCEDDPDCALESDTSVFFQLFSGKAGTLAGCRFLLTGATGPEYRTSTLAAAADGTHFCVGNSQGDIGVLEIQNMQTILRDEAFLQLNMKVWRDAA
jgi:hypothetical protein